MPSLELFPRHGVVGIFRGFREGGLEFHAELVLPYRSDFHSIPMHGQFILVQLESADEAVLGRIASFSSEGKLSSGYGEEFNLRAMRDERPVPDDLREEYLKYKVDIRVLGVVRISADDPDDLTFVPSHRRLPHVGSLVAFPSDKVLQKIVGEVEDGAEIGHFALGEYIYSHGRKDVQTSDWMQVKSPEVSIRFPIENLVSRRSFIFARAGFGKSNLNKLLFSKLYERTPTVEKRNGSKIPVGTILFDPDGEYFWPDDKNRPGLCDVPALQDKLVVFTSRKGPGPFYNSFVAGSIKLDIRRLNPSDVISIALSAERQEQQNVRKLRGLDQRSWEKLVNLIDAEGNQASVREVSKILQLEENKQEVEALAARSNMTNIVRTLHDKSSQLMDMLISALGQGKLCIVDVSQMRGPQSLILSGLILRRIFDRNQEEFTKANPRTIPTIAVVEEAQSVLNERSTSAEPYIAWVKEGRKYDLGALLITQQPGSIPTDILSQGDNWFIFHLLSSTDLINLQRANAHFSNDILSVLLNEPIPGQGIFWSSASKRAYPIPIRVLSFDHMYSAIDPEYNKPAADTFARRLKEKFQRTLEERIENNNGSISINDNETLAENGTEVEPIDTLAVFKNTAIESLSYDTDFMEDLKSRGKPWGVIGGFLEKPLPDTLEDRHNIAMSLVKDALERFLAKKIRHGIQLNFRIKREDSLPWVKIGKKS